MNVLVDTSVWSLALRRRGDTPPREVCVLKKLIQERRVIMIGPVRQELLSGVREEKQFRQLAQRLGAFPDLDLTTDDYVDAAHFFNLCLAKGVQGSNTDFLICAVAVRHDLAVHTTDNDFKRYAKHLPINFY